MDNSTIDKAVEGKYTEFSKEIKQELYNRMSAHDVSKGYANEYDKIQNMKAAYAAISGSEEE